MATVIPPAMRQVLRGARSTLLCLAMTAVLLVAVPPTHSAVPVIVDYHPDLARLVRIARYPVVAPQGLPRSWRPVSSILTVGGANGPATVTWQLGYWTSSGALASLAETDASPDAFVRRMTNDGTALPPVRIAGRTWQVRWNAGRNQRSLVETHSGVTVVVTGDATWAQLRVLAAALRPQHR